MSTLNVDTLADELGTGGPDFVGMPTVAGDPVVESGSNSDGEWTRWADGTQQVIKNDYDAGPANYAGSGTFSNPYRTNIVNLVFAASFISPPTVVVTNRSASGNADSRRSFAYTNVVDEAQAAGSQVIYIGDAVTSHNTRVHVIAAGRWK